MQKDIDVTFVQATLTWDLLVQEECGDVTFACANEIDVTFVRSCVIPTQLVSISPTRFRVSVSVTMKFVSSWRLLSSKHPSVFPSLRSITTTTPLPEPEPKTADGTDLDKKTTAQKNASLSFMDPFESIPLSRVATYLGEKFSPKLEEIKLSEEAKTRPKVYKEVLEPPSIPHFLPLTKWAANSREVRETLIVEEGTRQAPRLSWYHPDDTMVPRGWFSKGLWEDIKYYRPFLKRS